MNTLENVMDSLISPRYLVNGTTAVLLQGWFWHQITHKSWYSIKVTKPIAWHLYLVIFRQRLWVRYLFKQGFHPTQIGNTFPYFTCLCSEEGMSTYSLWKHVPFSYLPIPPLGRDMTQGQFLSGVEQVWIQSFPSPRLVASSRLKNRVCSTIYP